MNKIAFTVGQLARELELQPSTITRLARSGELAGHKRAGRWFFLPEDVRVWITNQKN